VTNPQIYDLITKKISKENVLIDEPMKKHTTFKIGGNADFFVKAVNEEEVKYVLDLSKENNIPLTIVGNGSNLLVSDNGIRGIVLKINIDNISVDNYIPKNDINDDEKVVVTAGAGVPLAKLAFYLLNNSISGFEFASGIPGTIGGAITMNAGAYGSEFKDIVIETKCMDYNGNIFILSNEQQKFEYRNSIFKKEKYIILETKMLLTFVKDKSIIKEKMDEYKASRLEKQPIEFPSAGSTFKRGKDFITAKLIDECGLKGINVGDAKVSDKHAGFVINTGNATYEDVLKLIDIIKKEVYSKFGKEIELEIELIG
jgi:UDP-N-acetylmuramate dehydrogenase